MKIWLYGLLLLILVEYGSSSLDAERMTGSFYQIMDLFSRAECEEYSSYFNATEPPSIVRIFTKRLAVDRFTIHGK